MDLTSEDFSALPGNRDRSEVRGILLMAFRHYRQFRILYPEPSVQLSGSGDGSTDGSEPDGAQGQDGGPGGAERIG